MIASKKSWKNEPMAKEREMLSFDKIYTNLDAEKMMKGFIPEDMDDKWFIYFENRWLYFHRSWTGHCIFKLKLDCSPTGARVMETWVTRNQLHYKSSGSEDELSMLSALIDNLLLRN
ncbi:MAG: hypothetical protein OEY96_11625 [Gammaproteobacteria bacterium]|nr:hypothetical protein [Gammaproteobacteria bacterium]